MDLAERTAASSSRHPWELARAAFLFDVLGDAGACDHAARPRILDVGCGDAFFARALLGRWDADVCCWDVNFSEDDVAALAGIAGLTPRREAPDGTFDVALLLDVLEHVDDDDTFLADVARRVRPGGWLLVTVPAWPALFSSHDVALAHRRRYTPAACRRLVERAGLSVVQSGGFFHGLLLPRGAAVFVEHVRRRGATLGAAAPAAPSSGVGDWRHGRALTGLVVAALRLEQRASRFWARRGIDAPGLSFFALCRVPSSGVGGVR